MTVEKFLKSVGIENYTCLGAIPNKRLSKVYKLYKHIEVCEFWYDDSQNPNLNNWIDVEGIGYGWIWLSYKNERSDKKLRKRLRNYAKYFRCNETVYTTIIDDISYYWWSLGDEIIQIRLSNNMLDFI